MEDNETQKNVRALLKKIEKDLDDGCEVHRYIMPDGKCDCSHRRKRISDNALKLIVEINLNYFGFERRNNARTENKK